MNNFSTELNMRETVFTDENGRMKRSLRFTIPDGFKGCTIKEFLRNELHFSNRQISSLKYREDGIRVGGMMQRVTYVLKAGDVLEIVPKSAGSLYLDHGTFTEPPDILYEDGDLLIVNKPSGMVCHPSPGHYADSLANQAAAYCARKKENWTIRVVGRLDKDTSGVVIFAKNSETAALISQKIPIEKTYYALAEGHFDDSFGQIDLPIASDETVLGKMKISEDGKPAQTFYEVIREISVRESPCAGVLETEFRDQADPQKTVPGELFEISPENSAAKPPSVSGDFCSLLKVRIVHGRTHQIRLHLASAGHPLVGDALYGHGIKEKTHAMLHCSSVRFEHPFSKEMIQIEAPFPEDWPV